MSHRLFWWQIDHEDEQPEQRHASADITPLDPCPDEFRHVGDVALRLLEPDARLATCRVSPTEFRGSGGGRLGAELASVRAGALLERLVADTTLLTPGLVRVEHCRRPPLAQTGPGNRTRVPTDIDTALSAQLRAAFAMQLGGLGRINDHPAKGQ